MRAHNPCPAIDDTPARRYAAGSVAPLNGFGDRIHSLFVLRAHGTSTSAARRRKTSRWSRSICSSRVASDRAVQRDRVTMPPPQRDRQRIDERLRHQRPVDRPDRAERQHR
ncbi:MAG: hypothetical protein IE932_14280 [Sphingopyxis terrae]|nr:hypothetical protein [Sphingopyxis terrae]